MKLLILPELLLLLCCMAQSPDCSRYKEGRFKATIEGKPYFIERKGGFQREYILGTPDSSLMTFHINWLSDCTYTIKPTDETLKKHPNIPPTAMMTSEIINTTDTSYTTKTTANFAALIDTATFVRAD